MSNSLEILKDHGHKNHMHTCHHNDHLRRSCSGSEGPLHLEKRTVGEQYKKQEVNVVVHERELDKY